MAAAKLGKAQRQFAVRAQTLVEDLHVAGTVHGLDRVIPLLGLEHEHVVAELVGVAGLLPQGHVHHLRGADLLVTVPLLLNAHVLLDHLVQRPSRRVPEHHARRFVLGVEQVELLADPTVIALLRLLHALQVLLELLLVRPGGAVYALQHLVAGIAAPVGAGQLGQLERPELAGARHVGSAAQVHPFALAVDGNFLVGGQLADDLHLVVFAQVGERGHGFVARHDDALHRKIRSHDLGHALLDLRQVLGRELVFTGKVVIEAVFDHRTDRHLCPRVEILHGHGEQVCGGVANDVEAGVVTVGDDRQLRVSFDQVAGIHFAAVDHPGQGGLGQSRADVGGHLGNGDGFGKFSLAAVRQRNGGHRASPPVVTPTTGHMRAAGHHTPL